MYFWDMTTVQGYSVSQMWDVWDEADPNDWDPNSGTGSSADDPPWRMNTAALTVLGFGNTHWTAATKYGLDR